MPTICIGGMHAFNIPRPMSPVFIVIRITSIMGLEIGRADIHRIMLQTFLSIIKCVCFLSVVLYHSGIRSDCCVEHSASSHSILIDSL